MLTGRSQTPEGEIAVFGDYHRSSNWVAKHAQAVWRLLLTLWTRGFYCSFASPAADNGVEATVRSASDDRTEELPPPCRTRPCPTRKEAALRHQCRSGHTRTCQIRAENKVATSDPSRAKATLLIWLQSAWLQARPTIWTREASSFPEPSISPTANARRPRGDA